MEGGQDPSERSTHTVRRLPGLQNLLSLDGGLGHGRVGRTQGGPAGRLQPLEDRGAGAVGVAAVGGSRTGTQAGGAPQVPAGRAREGSRAVGGGAAGGVFGLVVRGRPQVAVLLPSRVAAAAGGAGAGGLGVGRALLLPELCTPVLKPHLR